jgi:ribosome-associated protein
MRSLAVNTDHITLVQAVKMAGLADSGGQAKHLIREGGISVNGAIEKQPGRKLISGDRFQAQDGNEWTICRQ